MQNQQQSGLSTPKLPLTEENLHHHTIFHQPYSCLPMDKNEVSSGSPTDEDDDLIQLLDKLPTPEPYVQPNQKQHQLHGRSTVSTQAPAPLKNIRKHLTRQTAAQQREKQRHIPLNVNNSIPFTNKQLRKPGAHLIREKQRQSVKNDNVSIINNKPYEHAWNHNIFDYRNKTHIPIRDDYSKIFNQSKRIQTAILRRKQWQDTICFIITNFLHTGNKSMILDLPKYIRRYVLSGRFVLDHEKVLCFRHTRTQKMLRVVPASLLSSILRYTHTAYHHGSTKMRYMIIDKMGYWWPKMNYHIKTFCQCCNTCQFIKPGVKRAYARGNMKIFAATRPFQQISVDIVGPLPTSHSENRYIVTMIDKFSRYCMLVPTKDITGLSVIKAIDRWITTFGPPESILSDNGPQFISSIYTDYMKNHNDIKYRYTSTYHPQCNGQIERLHRWIKERLALIAFDEAKNFTTGEDDWSDYLSIIQYTYNTTPNKMTSYSPMHIILGRDDYAIEEYTFNSDNPREYIDFMADRQGIVHQRARERQNVYDQMRQSHHNKDRSKKQCEIGDKVLWNIGKQLSGSKKKLGPKWVGPYEVVDIFNDYQSYTIRIIPLPPFLQNNPMNPIKKSKRLIKSGRNIHPDQTEFNVPRDQIKPYFPSYESQFDGTQSPTDLSINVLTTNLYPINQHADIEPARIYQSLFHLYQQQNEMGYIPYIH